MQRFLVTGAGGFIGGPLVSALKQRGYWVRAVDRKLPEFAPTAADEYEVMDLRDEGNCRAATRGVDAVFALAADMGGMGHISRNHATILRNNTLIDLNTLEAARHTGVRRLLFASSACVYPVHKQSATDSTALREDDAYPAAPGEGYGWEKLMAELACGYYGAETDLEVRIARLHNVYGPYGAYKGGREKAPAALCRKVAEADEHGTVEIWGDGRQTRSFCYIDDCVEGLLLLMDSGYAEPLNIGSDELIAVDDLARLVAEVAGKPDLAFRHVPGPQGVRGRCSDNTLVRQVLGWAPTTTIREGIEPTYRWIEKMVRGS